MLSRRNNAETKQKWYEIHPSHIEDDKHLGDDNTIRTNE